MNTRELFLARQDVLKMIAVMQPELAKELGEMQKVQVATEAAAKIVGTQAEVDARLVEAEKLLALAKVEAELRLASVAEAEDLAQARDANSRKQAAAAEQHLKDLAKSKADLAQLIKDHEAKHKRENEAMAAERLSLNKLREETAALREALVAKERDLDAKHRRAIEAMS